MRVVIQRVLNASVEVDQKIISSISQGLLVFVGIEQDDQEEDCSWLTNKIIHLRIFSDKEGKMNRSVLDMSGEILVVSQFTLHASTKKGNRPSYIKAAKFDSAIPLYRNFIKQLQAVLAKPVRSGIFGADMKVNILNDGPVTIIIDSKHKE
ncbi:D-aminoacyl-tRNA deacylase [Gangjinia marincola]|uniref:D-aminoacyl-tRNA deacylase n=1 Tax=Gangjinia marincola TaxID=578463 RepID=A0ABP3XPR1_9FLAO